MQVDLHNGCKTDSSLVTLFFIAHSYALSSIVLMLFYCLHALADDNQRIQIREKMLEFSSTVLSTLSPFLMKNEVINTHTHTHV